MIIDSIRISPYQINFKKDYSNSKFSIDFRKGWILQLGVGDVVGYGDASPLDNFSFESYSQAGYGLEGFKLSMKNIGKINFEELLELSKAHGESQPSVQCCIESAIFDLASKLNDEFPQYQRKSYLIMLVSIFEDFMNQLCRSVEADLDIKASFTDFTGSGIERAKQYLSKLSTLSLPVSGKEWKHIKDAQAIRNVIAHAAGHIDKKAHAKQLKIIDCNDNYPLQLFHLPQSTFLEISLVHRHTIFLVVSFLLYYTMLLHALLF